MLLRWGWQGRAPLRRALAGWLVLRHGLLAPLMWVFLLSLASSSANKAQRVAEAAQFAPHERVMVLQASDPNIAVYLPLMLPSSPAWIVCSMARNAHRVTRVDEHTLELRSLRQGMFEQTFAELYRGPAYPLQPGDVVPIEGARFEISEMDGTQLRSIRVRFDAPPESGVFTFVAWRDGALVPVVLPAVGESIELPFSPGPMGI